MSHKRKYHKVNPAASATATAPDLSLHIQAYEATVIRAPHTLSTALSLEAPNASTLGVGATEPQIGSALIQWGANTQPVDSGPAVSNALEPKATSTWVDRYDARLLLDALPEYTDSITSKPRSLSPAGWSDLPSDTEDTFFFTPCEFEDYRREKRRRLIEKNREDRLRDLAAIEESEHPDRWGGSDEEPDETQVELMKRTAVHLLSSPNPAQLEMRILANHGADQRFAFLRGRWSRSWRTTKEKARRERLSAQSTQAPQSATLGGLAAYGDSEDGSEGSENGVRSSIKPGVDEGSATTLDAVKSRDTPLQGAEMEARRARAREWIAQRRALQEQTWSKNEDVANLSDS